MSDKISIPNKSHFTFDEVATITGVKKYVLRFWETEFDEIDPIISSAGQKLFEHNDIEAILRIKKLLFDEKLTIEKAKSILQAGEIDTLEDESVDEVVTNISEVSSAFVASTDNFNKTIHSSEMLREQLNLIIDLANSVQKRHNWI